MQPVLRESNILRGIAGLVKNKPCRTKSERKRERETSEEGEGRAETKIRRGEQFVFFIVPFRGKTETKEVPSANEDRERQEKAHGPVSLKHGPPLRTSWNFNYLIRLFQCGAF